MKNILCNEFPNIKTQYHTKQIIFPLRILKKTQKIDSSTLSSLNLNIWQLHGNGIEDVDKAMKRSNYVTVQGEKLDNSKYLNQISQNKIELLVEVYTNEKSFFHESKVLKPRQHLNPLSTDCLLIKRKKGNMGKTGLANIGNTCYMNGALQCLSHVNPLTEYFLSNSYKSHINISNPLGYKGLFAETYAKFLSKLYKTKHASISVFDLKRCLSMKAEQYHGFLQHDSQELLSNILDGLHEDLNRITKKPYIVEKEYDDSYPDSVISKERWENYLARNQSIIVDLFAGQFKSRVTCPLCSRVSISFDPFTILTLPIPQITELRIIYVPLNLYEPQIEIIHFCARELQG